MNKQSVFGYTDFTASDASNILVAASALEIAKKDFSRATIEITDESQNNDFSANSTEASSDALKFITNIVSVVQHNLKNLSQTDLIN